MTKFITRKKSTLETPLLRAIKQYLMCVHEMVIIRHNQMRVAKNRFIKIDPNDLGAPDLIACYRGVYVGFEIKVEGKKQTPKQIEFEKRILDAGGFYYVLTSINDAVNAIHDLNGRIK